MRIRNHLRHLKDFLLNFFGTTYAAVLSRRLYGVGYILAMSNHRAEASAPSLIWSYLGGTALTADKDSEQVFCSLIVAPCDVAI